MKENELISFGFKKVGDMFVLSVPIAPSVLWALWFLLLCSFCCVSWMLVHHWGYYGVKENRKVFAKTLYFVGGIGGLLLLAIFIGAYSFIQ
jgi:hypothetical protein